MASIRKRNGKWQVQVRTTGIKPISRTFITKAEAVRWSRMVQPKGRTSSISPVIRDLTVGDIMDRYVLEVSPTKRGRRREESIGRLIRNYPIFYTQLGDLTEGKAAFYRDARLKVAKPATVVRELAVLSHAIEIARRVWDISIDKNAFRQVHKPKVLNARTRRLEAGELDRILEAINRRGYTYLPNVIRLAIATAARGSELFNVRMEHIDLQRQTLLFPLTKNEQPRMIPMSPEANTIIRNMIAQAKTNDKLIVQSSHQIKRHWHLCVKEAGVSGLTFHDLRHEGISRYFEIGLTVPEVALISGHRDYKMLARYTHIRPESVAKKLAGIYRNQTDVPTDGS